MVTSPMRAVSMALLLCATSFALNGCRRAGPVTSGLPPGPSGDSSALPVPLPPPISRPDPFGSGTNTPVTLTSTDAGSGPAAPQPVSTNLPPVAPGEVDVRTGGQSLEQRAYAWAAGATQPRTNDPTVLRHEAVHWINGELSRNASWQDTSPGAARGFYIWGTNRYYVVPNTRLRKIDVLPYVPTHLTSSHQNYFYNFDFGSRDSLHLMEDFCAEIGSGEKSSLLFDMILFCSATGLKLEQLNASGGNKYWSENGGKMYRGTLKAMIEMAAPGLQGRLQAVARDNDPKTTALRAFLVRTYGDAWTSRVLGFSGGQAS